MNHARFLLAAMLTTITTSGFGAKLDPFAGSIQIDPTAFAYYRDRSIESVVSEVKANGLRAIRLIVTNDAAADAGIVEAFRKQGMAVWYETWGNGTYASHSLPPGSESWRMKLKARQAHEVAAGFTYLCMNNPEYRRWKKEQVVAVLKRIPFDGFEIVEPFLPAVNGPENDTYGCLCDHCKAAFLKMYPEETAIPEFLDEGSPNYYTKNRRLYEKWVDFRCHTVASFQDFIINSLGGVRDTCPKIKVAAWGIADDVPNPVETLREWQGSDGALIVKTVKPDMYVIQTDWPDWINPKLPADYPLKYKPYVDAVRRVSKVPIVMQADIGSNEKCRRGYEWMAKCEEAAKKAGMAGITSYEYHLNLDIYEAEPCPVLAEGEGNTVTIIFNKRLDPQSATNIGNYSVDSGSIVGAEVDGNTVTLNVEGRPKKVSVRNVSDDPTRRFFKGYPAATMTAEKIVGIRY